MNNTRASEEEVQKVMVKAARSMDEAPHILPLVRLGHKESYFSNRPFEIERYESMCALIRDKPNHYGGLYVEYDEDPVAFAFFILRPGLGSRSMWVTYVHSLYIRADIRSSPLGGYIWKRMMMAIRGWSVPRSSKGLIFNIMSGIAVQETDIVLRTAGATYLGGNYFLRI